MNGITFDTLNYFEKLKAAGVPEAQAKAQVEVMQGFISGYDEASRKELATKGDLQEVRTDLLRLENKFENRIEATKHDLLKWIIGLAFAQMALMTGLLAFLR